MSELSLTADQQLIESPSAAASPLPNTGFSGGADVGAQIKAFVRQPAILKALPVLGLFAVVALAATLWLALREPPQRDLFRGLPENEKGVVVQALEKSGIGFSLDSSSGALTVSEDDYHRAKMSLAAQGLPKSAPDGNSLLSSMPMGASRAVENENLRSARELDLARTIEAIDVVLSARVHLAVEAPSIFIRDRAEPSASVMLQLAGGNRLADTQVQSIIHLVASSVSGLSAEAVKIIDQNGRLMTQSGSDLIANKAGQHLMVQSRVEERYRQSLMSLLTPILGAENFTAEVTAEMDFSEKQATRESFPKDNSRIRSEQGSWSSDAGEKAAYGIPGALSNRPPEAATLQDEFQGEKPEKTEDGEKSRTSEKFARQFELGREVSVTKQAIGSVRRLSVAVALRSPMGKKQRSKEELASVKALVKGAIGFQEDRGDTVVVEARDFQTVEAVEENWWEAGWITMLVRNLSALLVALALIFGIGKPLLKKIMSGKSSLNKADRLQIASDIGNELNRSGGASQQPANPVSLEMINSAAGYSERAFLIQDFVRQNPDHAALVVQDLLAEGQGEEETADE